jgi:hypothetical protein
MEVLQSVGVTQYLDRFDLAQPETGSNTSAEEKIRDITDSFIPALENL